MDYLVQLDYLNAIIWLTLTYCNKSDKVINCLHLIKAKYLKSFTTSVNYSKILSAINN